MTSLQRSIRRVLVGLVVLAGVLVGVAVAAPGNPAPGSERAGRGPAPAAGEGASARSSARSSPPPVARVAQVPAPLPTWEPGIESARTYARSRTGVISFSVRTAERTRGFRADRVARSASVVKAMLLVAYLNATDVRARPLTAGERGLLAPMIQWSSNDAATSVHDVVGEAGLSRVATQAGMRDFLPAPAWGLSSITASDQTRFFLRLDRLVPARHRAYAMRLLRTIVTEQRWGLGRVVPRGWRLHLKGGWGSGSGVVNHQVALLRRGRERVAIAILTTENPSHDYGSETLRGVGKRLLRGLAAWTRDGSRSRRPCRPPQRAERLAAHAVVTRLHHRALVHGRLLLKPLGERRTGLDAQLREHPCQVTLHGPGSDRERRSDLPVREAAGRQ